MSAQELKPCPFCGGEAMIQFQIAGYCGARVSCVECDAETGGYKVKGDNDAADAQAITAWNIRTDLYDATKAQLAKAVEALRYMVDPELDEVGGKLLVWKNENQMRKNARAVLAEITGEKS
jgi:Lar family restriction alleviation protein